MSRQNLNGSDSLNAGYQKINANFIELYAGAGSGGSGGATELSALTDVDLTLPVSDNQALVYNGTDNVWENADIPSELDGLSDVNLTISPLTEFQVLQYDGTQWVNSKVTLGELNDVSVTSPTATQVLKYNPSSSKFENLKIYMNDIDGVSVGTLANKDILQYDSTASAWVNKAPTYDDETTANQFRVLSFIGGV